MLAPMRILVTGGAGFIGAHTVSALLEAGHEVVVLDDLSTGQRDRLPEVPFLKGDVRDQVTVFRALRGCDAVVHLAARSSVPDSFRDPVGVESVNDLGSATVLDCAWRRGIRRVVLASSASVYGQGEPLHERLPLAPRSPYAASKVAMEALGAVYRERGCAVASLRYFNVYGPGQRDGVLPTFLAQLHRGEPLSVDGDGRQSRDFVHVLDVARANVQALAWDGEVNIASGRSTSILDLIDRVSQVLGRPLSRVHGPPRELDSTCCTASTLRAREWGWGAQISLDAGLRGMLLADPERLDRDRAGGMP